MRLKNEHHSAAKGLKQLHVAKRRFPSTKSQALSTKDAIEKLKDEDNDVSKILSQLDTVPHDKLLDILIEAKQHIQTLKAIQTVNRIISASPSTSTSTSSSSLLDMKSMKLSTEQQKKHKSQMTNYQQQQHRLHDTKMQKHHSSSSSHQHLRGTKNHRQTPGAREALSHALGSIPSLSDLFARRPETVGSTTRVSPYITLAHSPKSIHLGEKNIGIVRRGEQDGTIVLGGVKIGRINPNDFGDLFSTEQDEIENGVYPNIPGAPQLSSVVQTGIPKPPPRMAEPFDNDRYPEPPSAVHHFNTIFRHHHRGEQNKHEAPHTPEEELNTDSSLDIHHGGDPNNAFDDGYDFLGGIDKNRLLVADSDGHSITVGDTDGLFENENGEADDGKIIADSLTDSSSPPQGDVSEKKESHKNQHHSSKRKTDKEKGKEKEKEQEKETDSDKEKDTESGKDEDKKEDEPGKEGKKPKSYHSKRSNHKGKGKEKRKGKEKGKGKEKEVEKEKEKEKEKEEKKEIENEKEQEKEQNKEQEREQKNEDNDRIENPSPSSNVNNENVNQNNEQSPSPTSSEDAAPDTNAAQNNTTNTQENEPEKEQEQENEEKKEKKKEEEKEKEKEKEEKEKEKEKQKEKQEEKEKQKEKKEKKKEKDDEDDDEDDDEEKEEERKEKKRHLTEAEKQKIHDKELADATKSVEERLEKTIERIKTLKPTDPLESSIEESKKLLALYHQIKMKLHNQLDQYRQTVDLSPLKEPPFVIAEKYSPPLRWRLGELQAEERQNKPDLQLAQAIAELSALGDDKALALLLNKVDNTLGDIYTREVGNRLPLDLPPEKIADVLINKIHVTGDQKDEDQLYLEKVDDAISQIAKEREELANSETLSEEQLHRLVPAPKIHWSKNAPVVKNPPRPPTPIVHKTLRESPIMSPLYQNIMANLAQADHNGVVGGAANGGSLFNLNVPKTTVHFDGNSLVPDVVVNHKPNDGGVGGIAFTINQTPQLGRNEGSNTLANTDSNANNVIIGHAQILNPPVGIIQLQNPGGIHLPKSEAKIVFTKNDPNSELHKLNLQNNPRAVSADIIDLTSDANNNNNNNNNDNVGGTTEIDYKALMNAIKESK